MFFALLKVPTGTNLDQNECVKPAKSEVVDPELVIGVSTGRNHMESEPVFGYREESMKR